MAVTEEYRAEVRRAYYRARMVLKQGDRISCTRCGGIHTGYTFNGWDGYWIVSASGIDDLSPSCITKLNGKPVSFMDGGDFDHIEYDEAALDPRCTTCHDRVARIFLSSEKLCVACNDKRWEAKIADRLSLIEPDDLIPF